MKTFIILFNFLLITLILYTVLTSKTIEALSGCSSSESNALYRQQALINRLFSELNTVKAQYGELDGIASSNKILIGANKALTQGAVKNVADEKAKKQKELDDLDTVKNVPGGASGGILPASLNNIPLDYGVKELEDEGCFLGSAAIVILSDQDKMKDVGLSLLRFFEEESCGQCTPCRVGTEKTVKEMKKEKWSKSTLTDLSIVMADASICGLGQAACNPLNSIIKYFPEEFQLND